MRAPKYGAEVSLVTTRSTTKKVVSDSESDLQRLHLDWTPFTKLCVPDEEIAKWKLAVVSFGRVEYLEDEDVVRSRFRKHDNYGNWDDYLGLEHPQVPGTGRKKHTARTHHDKPVKIYG